MIGNFTDKYRFLSNYWPATVIYDGMVFTSVQHAFVAAKTTDMEKRERVRQQPTASMAKRYGRRSIIPRDGWNDMRLAVMEDLIRQKFQDPTLKAQLLATGDEELVEGNTWGDTFWGVCRGKGANHLGKILMRVREEIRNQT